MFNNNSFQASQNHQNLAMLTRLKSSGIKHCGVETQLKVCLEFRC